MNATGLAEAVAAAAIGVGLLWMVFQPISGPVPVDPLTDVPFDPEETAQGQALLAIKDIEFDHATGKLSDEDFSLLRGKYQAAALAAMASSPTPPPRDRVEELVAARVAAVERAGGGEGPAAFCPSCGSPLPADGRFCPTCGHPVPFSG